MIQPPPKHEDEAIAEANETYVRMARAAHDAGREIPAVPVSPDAPMARSAVEQSQRLMRQSRRRTFGVPALPWKKGKYD